MKRSIFSAARAVLSQLPSYLSDHSGLLKKFTAWERDSEMLVRRVAHAPQPLRAEDEEGPDEDEQDAQEEGNREEGGQRQEDEEEESGKDAERLFIFLTKTRGWKIVPQEGDVMRICAMKGSTPVEEADVRRAGLCRPGCFSVGLSCTLCGAATPSCL